MHLLCLLALLLLSSTAKHLLSNNEILNPNQIEEFLKVSEMTRVGRESFGSIPRRSARQRLFGIL